MTNNPRSRIYKLLENSDLEAIVKNLYGTKALLTRSEALGGGLFNTTYYLETESPESKLVLRIAPVRQELLFDFEKKMMSAEPYIYRLMNENKVPCPRVVKHDNSRAIISREYLITEYVEGALTLDSPLIPEEAKPSLWFDVGQLTSKLHHIKANQFGWINPDGSVRGSENWAEIILAYVNEIVERSYEHSVYDEATIRQIDHLFSSHKSLFEINQKPSFVHNDIWGPNVLVTQKEGRWSVESIIDADRAMFADPESEFLLWDPHSSAVRGYGKELDMTKEGILRRHFYMLKHFLFDAYVHKVEYDNENAYLNTKNLALDQLKLIKEYH